jgi:hypothetical protein
MNRCSEIIEPPGHSSSLANVVRPLSILAIAIAAVLSATAASAAEKETCYKDDTGRIVKRQRPGYVEVPCPAPGEATPQPAPRDSQFEGGGGREARREGPPRAQPNAVSPIPRPAMIDYQESTPIPDRWRIVEALGYKDQIIDPYNRNPLKADRPLWGEDWFFSLALISDTFAEDRDVPTPVGGIASERPGENGIFGGDNQMSLQQNIISEFVVYKGNTTFKPPDYEYRFTPVFNYNYLQVDELQVTRVNPLKDQTTRKLGFVGIQAAFFDKHLRNVSERYDFDSFRIGIQPFSSDFRGFLFQDSQLGVRLFGIRDNNFWQYNLAAFRRLEKDTNTGLNDVGRKLRDDDVFVANVYRQDWPVVGFVSQATVLHNRNREADRKFVNKNGLQERPSIIGRANPRDYDVTYLGYNGDGHFGRLNLTTSLYYAIGDQSSGTFTQKGIESDIRGYFGAVEASLDYDWIRPRISFLYASGDDDPFDDESNGFDSVFENPQFGGSDTSYAIRQSVPLINGGGVALSTRNGILNNLRSTKEQGQSNFDNPGTMMFGVGVDLDLMPEVRLTLNANSLYMTEPETVEALRLVDDIDNHLGYDLSASVIWRPLMSQNIVIRAAYATILPADGFKTLFPDQDLGYFMLNALFAY